MSSRPKPYGMPWECWRYLLRTARADDRAGKTRGMEAELWEHARFDDAGVDIIVDPATPQALERPAGATLH